MNIPDLFESLCQFSSAVRNPDGDMIGTLLLDDHGDPQPPPDPLLAYLLTAIVLEGNGHATVSFNGEYDLTIDLEFFDDRIQITFTKVTGFYQK